MPEQRLESHCRELTPDIAHAAVLPIRHRCTPAG